MGPVNMFTTTILEKLDKTTNGTFPIDPIMGTFLIMCSNLIFAFIGAFIGKSVRRKIVFVVGNFIMGCMHILLGVFLVIEQYEAMFACMVLYIAVF
jgi:Sugar (and other) transporter